MTEKRNVTTVDGIESFGLHSSGLDTDPRLKRCPFCGHAAAIRVGDHSHWWDPFRRDQGVWPNSVECTNTSCAVKTPEQYGTRELAIEAWNRRTADSAEAEQK